MSRTRWTILLAGMSGLLLTGCGELFTVPNPDYAAWVDFEPGSYVTFEGEQLIGTQTRAIRITEELVTKNKDYVILERTTEVVGQAGDAMPVRRVESARIDPAEDPRTHPGAVIRDLGTETIEVAGQTFDCPVRELELHARAEGFIDNAEDMMGRAAVHPDMPGRFVKVFVQARTPHHKFEMSGQIVDFRAIREDD